MAQWTQKVWCAFQSAGLVPAGAELPSKELASDANLLPFLCELWRPHQPASSTADCCEEQHSETTPQPESFNAQPQAPACFGNGPGQAGACGWALNKILARCANSDCLQYNGQRQIAEWLEEEQGRGAALTLGVPGLSDDVLTRWLGHRLFFWPTGIPQGRRVGIVSSRLGRALDEKRDWFGVLRTACLRLDPVRDILLTAAETTTFRFLEHCAARFGLRVLRVDVTGTSDLSRWIERLTTCRDTESNSMGNRVIVSPILIETIDLPSGLADTPIRDRVVMTLSDHVLALHLRPNGNLHRLTCARLKDSAWPPGRLYVALGDGLVGGTLASELQDLGAVGWILLEDDSRATECGPPYISHSPAGATSTPAESAAAPIVSIPSSDQWQYLTHCTRRQRGHWPDQTDSEFLDELLFESDTADRSAFAALVHIIQQRRLFASCEGIRGKHRVVSFTAVPLIDLPRQRVFRPHRGRWDFEPYGICIRRDWLETRGTRPVSYGDDDLWESLPEPERLFFQKQITRSRKSERVVDWSSEREWRHVGDVDLAHLPKDEGLVFVPTIHEAQQLAAISPWPITVVEGFGTC